MSGHGGSKTERRGKRQGCDPGWRSRVLGAIIQGIAFHGIEECAIDTRILAVAIAIGFCAVAGRGFAQEAPAQQGAPTVEETETEAAVTEESEPSTSDDPESSKESAESVDEAEPAAASDSPPSPSVPADQPSEAGVAADALVVTDKETDGVDSAPEEEVQPAFVPTVDAEARRGAMAKDESDSGGVFGDLQWRIDPEYRVRTVAIQPLEINGTTVKDMQWTEQRFRLDTTMSKPKVGAIHFQADILDGVLFGDNGSFGGSPSSNSGVSLTSNRPNVSRWEVGLPPGGDPLRRDSYVPVLAPADIWEINYLYGDVFLPFGILRVGRQPKKYGAGIPSHDGGPHNRWGVSKNSDAADRILFGTKLDEAIYFLTEGSDHVPDTSLDNGLIFALFYDWQVQGELYVPEDDLNAIGTTLEYRREEADWFGLKWRDVGVSSAAVFLSNESFSSSVLAVPSSIKGRVEDLELTLNHMAITGQSREISIGFAELSSGEAEVQTIRAQGFQAIVDYFLGPLTLTLEFDFATGDDDPRTTTPLTTFNFARDMNVGLLLFEHIMAFESARSAAVGIENLSGLDSSSFPLTEVSTEGRFTNGIVLFPQVKVDIFQSVAHAFHTRIGALFAWSQASGGVVDPIMTALAEDGLEIEDDAVNFHGGEPARYYGTEVDLQLGYVFKDYFYWTVEGAVLFPGPALYDKHGGAVNSFLVENRFEFRF